MPAAKFSLSGYRGMWLFVLFDLPVKTKLQRRRYTRFRKLLLQEGFSQLQFSVYARYCASEETSSPFRQRVRLAIPSDGRVRLMQVTDRQFGKMEVFFGQTQLAAEKPPDQLMLF